MVDAFEDAFVAFVTPTRIVVLIYEDNAWIRYETSTQDEANLIVLEAVKVGRDAYSTEVEEH